MRAHAFLQLIIVVSLVFLNLELVQSTRKCGDHCLGQEDPPINDVIFKGEGGVGQKVMLGEKVVSPNRPKQVGARGDLVYSVMQK